MEGAAQLSTLPSVERWSPLIVRPMIATKKGAELDVQLVRYDPRSAVGGPLRIAEGKELPGPGEVIVDEALSPRYGVENGDRIGAAGRDWTVVGMSSGGDFVASQTIFVVLDQAQEARSLSLHRAGNRSSAATRIHRWRAIVKMESSSTVLIRVDSDGSGAAEWPPCGTDMAR